MAGVKDDELRRLRGFPAGVNQVAPDDDLPTDDNGSPVALREAVNVDLVGPRKRPRRRHGYTQRMPGRCHSPGCLPATPVGDVLLQVLDGDLVAFNTALAPLGTLRAGIGPNRVTYAEVNGDLYWSNGLQMRRIRGEDLADTPAWIDAPGVPDADAYPDGGLAAGTYRVAMTWLDGEGREGGAVGVVEVDLQAGQGIRVHAIPLAPESAAHGRIYVSMPDGEELYAAMDVLPGTSQVLLGVGAGEGGKALETLWRQPLPPCEILRFWNGVLLGASRNLLVWSDPLRFGLTTHDNYLRVGADITLLEPLGEGGEGAGCWIADHKRTYWMAGRKPSEWRRVIRYDHPAVPGTSILVKGTVLGLETTEPVAFWLAANGVFCAGLPGGTVVPLTEGRLALAEGEVGASLFREHAGLRGLITSFISRGANGLAVGDRAVASVTRHP